MEYCLEEIENENAGLKGGKTKREETRFKNLSGSHQVKNNIRKMIDLGYTGTKRNKDKSDISVVEKVIDKKTERMFSNWKKNGIVEEVYGCISAGKEANVYYAVDPQGKELAVKIYKVETMVFKDREDYIEGEFRFKRGYCRSSPFKLIQVWAEKEFRNLKRIKEAGINCPTPLIIKDNLIVMEFLGDKSKAFPRLKDVRMDVEEHAECYLEIVRLMRRLWRECRMVHGDLSPYNLLFNEGDIYIIDVSQSVEEDHPLSIEFLKRDMRNINNYYKHLGIHIFKIRSMFDFITDKNLSDEEVEDSLENMMDEALEMSDTEEEILQFLASDIPRSLADIPLDKLEEELEKVKMNFDSILYSKLVGLIDIQKQYNLHYDDDMEADSDSEDIKEKPAESKGKSEDGEEIKEKIPESLVGSEKVVEEGQDSSEGGEEEEAKRKGQFDPFEGMTKQERKKLVKEEKREKRKVKLPKKDKHRLTKK